MKTNRDLYLGIAELLKQRREPGVAAVTLEDYLRRMIRLAQRFSDQTALSLDEFFGILRAAFEDPGELESTPAGKTPLEFHKWVSEVTRQIEDLKAMARGGQLENDLRYFGINAPSGRRWYNFDPCTYIECGVEGAFGGWEEGDDTGRSLVPGQVACLDAGGRIVSRDPKDVPEPIVELPRITWEMLSSFIWYGQNYE